jgi:hypothetical protein
LQNDDDGAGLAMAVNDYLEWLGAGVMIVGLVVECAAMVGTNFHSLARCLPFVAVGSILFCLGVIIPIEARAM